MKDLAKFFGLTVSALLPLINPLGSALVFMGVVGAAPAAVYRALSKRIALNTTLFMLVIQAAGPGCIVVMVTLSAHASTNRGLPILAAHAGIILAVSLLSVAVWFCYGHAPAITRRVSPQTAHGILRVIAFVLLCIGVQITWNGLEVLLKSGLKS